MLIETETISPSEVRVAAVRPAGEPAWVRRGLIGVAVGVLLLILVLPLLVIFHQAFAAGARMYWEAVNNSETWMAVRLTLLTVIVSVPLNTIFGVAAAWCVTKYRFPGRSILLTLIDLPFSVSPVVAGLALVVLLGRQSTIGHWLILHHIKIIYALPGIVLATVFITFPFVARELIPLMEAQGTEEEEAARVLGGNGWQIFWRVTLPNIRWGLIYGVILCNARAIGEFGAVYAVSANFPEQMTLPLRVNDLYLKNLVSMTPAFAVSTLLAAAGLVTLIVKSWLEKKK